MSTTITKCCQSSWQTISGAAVVIYYKEGDQLNMCKLFVSQKPDRVSRSHSFRNQTCDLCYRFFFRQGKAAKKSCFKPYFWQIIHRPSLALIKKPCPLLSTFTSHGSWGLYSNCKEGDHQYVRIRLIFARSLARIMICLLGSVCALTFQNKPLYFYFMFRIFRN